MFPQVTQQIRVSSRLNYAERRRVSGAVSQPNIVVGMRLLPVNRGGPCSSRAPGARVGANLELDNGVNLARDMVIGVGTVPRPASVESTAQRCLCRLAGRSPGRLRPLPLYPPGSGPDLRMLRSARCVAGKGGTQAELETGGACCSAPMLSRTSVYGTQQLRRTAQRWHTGKCGDERSATGPNRA